ncbi:MAG: FMN-binding protein [Thiohalobacterales bacterium]|nr:FMN-binding protein [Thiohalobacterales bacterium]
MKRLIALLLLLPLAGPAPAGGTYQTPEDFLDEVFAGTVPDAQVLWLKGDVRETSTAIMGHRYPGIRVRYGLKDNRSAWILEEIGKEKPITTGLVINTEGIERLRVLVFRESRGWEVKHPFFTDQFPGIGLTAGHELDGNIDGISGATLSVRALKKLARLALYFHGLVVTAHDTAT